MKSICFNSECQFNFYHLSSWITHAKIINWQIFKSFCNRWMCFIRMGHWKTMNFHSSVNYWVSLAHNRYTKWSEFKFRHFGQSKELCTRIHVWVCKRAHDLSLSLIVMIDLIQKPSNFCNCQQRGGQGNNKHWRPFSSNKQRNKRLNCVSVFRLQK